MGQVAKSFAVEIALLPSPSHLVETAGRSACQEELAVPAKGWAPGFGGAPLNSRLKYLFWRRQRSFGSLSALLPTGSTLQRWVRERGPNLLPAKMKGHQAGYIPNLVHHVVPSYIVRIPTCTRFGRPVVF